MQSGYATAAPAPPRRPAVFAKPTVSGSAGSSTDGPPAPASGVPSLPVVWRPRLGRLVVYAMAIVVTLTGLAIAALLPAEVRAGFSGPQVATLVVLWAGLMALGWALSRPRVLADAAGLTVVNMVRTRRLEWAEVVSVRMASGDPWVLLDVSDGTTLPAMGIQSADGDRGRRAARELRALVDRYSQPEGSAPA